MCFVHEQLQAWLAYVNPSKGIVTLAGHLPDLPCLEHSWMSCCRVFTASHEQHSYHSVMSLQQHLTSAPAVAIRIKAVCCSLKRAVGQEGLLVPVELVLPTPPGPAQHSSDSHNMTADPAATGLKGVRTCPNHPRTTAMSYSPAQEAPDGAAGFDRYTELLLACAPYLHVTAIARVWASSKELHGACQAVTQAQFPRLLQQLLKELRAGYKDSRAAALSWLCDMAGRAAVAAASQQCLDLGCYGNGLTQEDVQVLVAHGARVTCQMVVDAARRGVDGAEVWLLAGAVDNAPDLLLWTSKGDPAHVERLRGLLYNTDQLPPQQQLLDALRLAGNMMRICCLKQRGLGLLCALLVPPRRLSSGASPHARKQQLWALVPAADLERLLLAVLQMEDNDGSVIVATALCSCPAAGELPGAAVLDLLQWATCWRGGADLVFTLGRLPGAADMPLDQVASLLPAADAHGWRAGDDVLRVLLDLPRVQQAINADVAGELLRCAVDSDLDFDTGMFQIVRGSVAAGLVTTEGLAAAMEQCWNEHSGDGWEPRRLWEELWSFPAAEGMSAEQLHGVLYTAITHGCFISIIEEVLADNPFVQQRVDWHSLLQAVAHELRTSSNDDDKPVMREQLVWLVSVQASKLTISESQATELLQAVVRGPV